ncbi:sensor histidine kinase [Paenimyroides tangerinum]|uniref:Sensor histidine kinase n=1 Tax=Paenimyroides tangerinum TaxID=2488728 RepID=A0A3P3WC37_9FLAO|nr:histidine kinase [Paenimyroides tangerinum]RRJ92725.1 sensor histidine kinase [Paenimyroides tangerinum]
MILKELLWIGSRAGLSKKKMNSFEIVGEATKHKFNNIFDITEDENKKMWIAGYGQGILCFDKYSSRLINTKNGLVNDFVRVVFPFKDKIYAGTLNGISIISKDDFSIINPSFIQNPNYDFSVSSFFEINDKVYVTTINDGLYVIENDELIKVNDIKKIFSSYVWKGNIYLGTETELLIVDSEKFEIITKYQVPSVWQFYPYKGKMCFISSGIYDNDGGIYRLEDEKLVNRVVPLKVPFLDLKSFAYDNKNEFLYIGTQNNGLIQVNLNASIFYQNGYGKVYSLLFDRNKEYVFHDKGLSIITNNESTKNVSLHEFKKYQEKNDDKFKDYTIITNHFYPIDYNIPENRIIFYNSLINKNTIWVSSNIGMFELDLNGKITKYHPIHVFIFTFFEGKLTTVVPYGGIRIFENINTMENKYFHNWNNPNIPADIVSIANFDNALYFASALTGLYEYKNGVFKSFLVSKEFTEPKLKRITKSNNGNLIIVTDFNDVYEFDVNQSPIKIIRHINHQKIKGSTTAFVSEIEGILYVGTNLGINVFKENKYFFINKSQGFTNYNINKAITFDSKLFVLTSNGYYVLDNSNFKNKKQTINFAKITKILVNNKKLDDSTINNISNGLVLNYTENNINIFFTVTNEKFPDKLKFKYRLKSTESWTDLINDTQINLSYLDKGFYDLEIQISNEDNGNVSIQSLVKIEIEPPYYLKLPFIIAIIIAVILISILIIKLRINIIQSSQRKKMKLIELQAEQEKKELMFDKQLAEVKLQALKSQMNSHFLFNVLSSIQFYIITKDVDNALYYLERFSSLIRRTLDFSDKKSISLSEEIDYLKQYIEIENIRVENQITFEVNVESNLNLNSIEISPLLLQPFVENSIVHAFPASIEKPLIKLSVERYKGKIQILIEDNGIGNKNNKNTTHNSKGISIVKKRLDLTQKNFEKNIDILFSDNGTKVLIILDS